MMKIKSRLSLISILFFLILILIYKTADYQLIDKDLDKLKKFGLETINTHKINSLDKKNYKIYQAGDYLPEDVRIVFKGSTYSQSIGEKYIYMSLPITNKNEVKTVLRLRADRTDYSDVLNFFIIILTIIYAAIIYFYYKNYQNKKNIAYRIEQLTSNPSQTNYISNPNNPLGEKLDQLALKTADLLNNQSYENDLLESLTDSLDFPIFIFNQQGKIISKNSSFITNFTNIKDLKELAFLDDFSNLLISSLIKKENQIETIYLKPYDSYYQVKISNLEIIDDSFLVVMQDVSKYIKSDIIQKDFVANVSHELKTPLTSIIGFSDILRQGKLEKKQVEDFSKIINNEAKRLENMVQDTLSLTRSRQKVNKANLDFPELINDLIEKYKEQIIEKDLQIITHLEPINIQSDYNLLYAIIKNIFENSIFYTPRYGNIHLSLIKEDKKIILKIEDNGIGISLADQERIFERFYRADAARTNVTNGTGLGLAIVKHNANLLKIEVKVESQLGKGTKISIII